MRVFVKDILIILVIGFSKQKDVFDRIAVTFSAIIKDERRNNMKILGVVGSPRKKGNTSVLMKETLKPLETEGIETEVLFLSDYHIKDCNGCEGCKDTYKCIIDDDMQKLYPAIIESDALILGSPTYFYNITGDMKAFIDRLYCFEIFADNDRSIWISYNEALGGKYATVIAVSEQEKAEDMGFASEAMEKPLEALGYRVISTVKVLHVFGAGEALKNENAMKEAKQAGEKLLKSLQLKEKVKKQLS